MLAIVAFVFRYLSLSAVWKYAPRDTAPARVDFWRGMRERRFEIPNLSITCLPFVMFTTGEWAFYLSWMPFFASQNCWKPRRSGKGQPASISRCGNHRSSNQRDHWVLDT